MAVELRLSRPCSEGSAVQIEYGDYVWMLDNRVRESRPSFPRSPFWPTSGLSTTRAESLLPRSAAYPPGSPLERRLKQFAFSNYAWRFAAMAGR
jgi:hypothetical protein